MSKRLSVPSVVSGPSSATRYRPDNSASPTKPGPNFPTLNSLGYSPLKKPPHHTRHKAHSMLASQTLSTIKNLKTLEDSIERLKADALRKQSLDFNCGDNSFEVSFSSDASVDLLKQQIDDIKNLKIGGEEMGNLLELTVLSDNEGETTGWSRGGSLKFNGSWLEPSRPVRVNKKRGVIEYAMLQAILIFGII